MHYPPLNFSSRAVWRVHNSAWGKSKDVQHASVITLLALSTYTCLLLFFLDDVSPLALVQVVRAKPKGG